MIHKNVIYIASIREKGWSSMKLKLSIAIPTFGAPKAVTNNVKRILKCDRADIEVLVSDNDETGEQLKDIIEVINDSRFRYYKNDRNIGRNNNIAKAVELSRADYVLLISSDDELYMDALNEILETIDAYPNIGIILGTMINSYGQTGFESKPAGVYQNGCEAFINLPFLGDLMPMVINKSYIDFKKCYNQNEYYMQQRLALYAAGQGNLVFLKNKMGYMISSEEIHLNPSVYESFANKSFSSETWDLNVAGHVYYSHTARIIQLKQYISIIEEFDLRLNQKMQVIEYWTSKMLAKALFYVSECRNPFPLSIEKQGFQGIYSYNDILKVFEYEMCKFFAKREAEEKYFFLGKLRDMIKNETIILNQAEQILKDVMDYSIIGVFGKDSVISKKLHDLLKMIGIETTIVSLESNVKDMLILEPRMYNKGLDEELKSKGAYKIHFMDRMAKYLGIVWCSRISDPKLFADYSVYMD